MTHLDRNVHSSSTTRVVLLGTGTPNADPERSGPSVAIVVSAPGRGHDTPYLVDFGPGVVRRAAAAHRAGIEGLAVERLNRAFLTHLHSDHTAGYPDLLLTPWVLERIEDLHVYGPAGLDTMTEHILAAYQQDIRERLEGLEPAHPTGYHALAHEIRPGEVYHDANVRVEAFAVDHGSWPALGFKFHTPDRTVVLSGDTAPTETLVQQARGCDLLIHEVYSAAGFETLPLAWQRYHARVHTSSHQLAQIAAQVRPGLLVLYHQLFWGVPDSDLLYEIKDRYDGPVVSGKDLDVY
jgi:ribonuclease BN (tRNA processing enzyme)